MLTNDFNLPIVFFPHWPQPSHIEKPQVMVTTRSVKLRQMVHFQEKIIILHKLLICEIILHKLLIHVFEISPWNQHQYVILSAKFHISSIIILKYLTWLLFFPSSLVLLVTWMRRLTLSIMVLDKWKLAHVMVGRMVTTVEHLSNYSVPKKSASCVTNISGISTQLMLFWFSRIGWLKCLVIDVM